jgi:hypothetical protein
MAWAASQGAAGSRSQDPGAATALAERDERIAKLQREVADKTDKLARIAKEYIELKGRLTGKPLK